MISKISEKEIQDLAILLLKGIDSFSRERVEHLVKLHLQIQNIPILLNQIQEYKDCKQKWFDKAEKQTKILDEIKEIISVAIEEDGYIEPEMNLSKIEQILEKMTK